jgi:hypothetical protein
MTTTKACMAALIATVSLAVGAPAEAAGDDPIHRVAVVVGANAGHSAAPPLRFAHRDATRVADTLRELGGFAADDTHLLLDPEPGALLSVLDRALADAEGAQTLLLLYYSGHADEAAVYPAGERLPLDALRERIDDPRVTVRVGIVDACGGGQWTGAKGLTPGAPFEVPAPLELASAGSVLIASSSGSQSAHELEALGGSLFTHHLVQGLRGGADDSGEGEITVAEAFAYARAATVKDAVLQLGGADQDPSFHVDLRGRQDLVLTRVDAGPSVVEVQQAQGPLELVDLHTSVTILSLEPGVRAIELALPPGRYLLRRRGGDGQYAAELTLALGERRVITEEQLELVAVGDRSAKGGEPRGVAFFDLPPRHAEIRGRIRPWVFGDFETRVVLGADPGALRSGILGAEEDAAIGVSDRVQVLLPGMLRAGLGPERGGVVWGGLRSAGFTMTFDEEDALRLEPTATLGLGADLRGRGAVAPIAGFALGTLPGRGLRLDGARLDLYGAVTAPGPRVRAALPIGVGAVLGPAGEVRPELGLGSVATPGGMRLPLLQVLVDGDLGLYVDGYAAARWSLGARPVSGVPEAVGMIGVTVLAAPPERAGRKGRSR